MPSGRALLKAIDMGPKKSSPFDKKPADDEPAESKPDLSTDDTGDGDDAEDMAGDDFLDAIAPDMDEGKREDAKAALRRYVQACVQKAMDGDYGGGDEDETEK
jgi:hypothetical protein